MSRERGGVHLHEPNRPSSHSSFSFAPAAGRSLLFAYLPIKQSRIVFVILFAIFRAAYNVGLGWILRKQSTKRFIVREIVNRGWLDAAKQPQIARWCKRELEGKMGDSYVFEDAPVEFTVWLLFRQVSRPARGNGSGNRPELTSSHRDLKLTSFSSGLSSRIGGRRDPAQVGSPLFCIG